MAEPELHIETGFNRPLSRPDSREDGVNGLPTVTDTPGGEDTAIRTKDGRVVVEVSDTKLDNYVVMKAIGKGKFSTVYRARRKSDNIPVALKKIQIFNMMDEKSREKCLKEIGLVNSLSHENIIAYLDSFIVNKELILVFEYAEAGDLKRQLRKAREREARFDERVIWRYFGQIADAVAHMHERRVMHRDLKPANIFLTREGKIKVGDLGLGRFLSEHTLEAYSKVGTPLYMSPEVLRGKGYEWSSDVWSLGCVLYELAMLKSPFKEEGLNLFGLFQKINKGEYAPISEVYSGELRKLADAMLHQDPSKRPDVQTVAIIAHEMETELLRQRETQSAIDHGASPTENEHKTNESPAADVSNKPPTAPKLVTPKSTPSNQEIAISTQASQPNTRPNTQPDIQPNTQPNTQPDIQPNTQPNTQPDSQPDTQKSMPPHNDVTDTNFANVSQSNNARHPSNATENDYTRTHDGTVPREQMAADKPNSHQSEIKDTEAYSKPIKDNTMKENNPSSPYESNHEVLDGKRPSVTQELDHNRNEGMRPTQQQYSDVSPVTQGEETKRNDRISHRTRSRERHSQQIENRQNDNKGRSDNNKGQSNLQMDNNTRQNDNKDQLDMRQPMHKDQVESNHDTTKNHQLQEQNMTADTLVQEAQLLARISDVILLSDVLFARLWSLNFESTFCDQLHIPYLHQHFFTVPAYDTDTFYTTTNTPTSQGSNIQQLHTFVRLAAWLWSLTRKPMSNMTTGTCNLHGDPYFDIFHLGNDLTLSSPHQISTSIVSALSNHPNISDVFLQSIRPVRIAQGYGVDICRILAWLAAAALTTNHAQWISPAYDEIYSLTDSNTPQTSSQILDGAQIDEGDDLEISTANDSLSDSGSVAYETMIGGMGKSNKSHHVDEMSQQDMVHATVDPTLWAREVERVAPRLSTKSNMKFLAVTTSSHTQRNSHMHGDWRMHHTFLQQHATTLCPTNARQNSTGLWSTTNTSTVEKNAAGQKKNKPLISTLSSTLQSIVSSCADALSRISNAEERLSHMMGSTMADEYSGLRSEHKTLETSAINKQQELTTIAQQLAELDEQAEELQEKLAEKGNNVSNTEPLQKIRAALVHLRRENKLLDIRVGVTLQVLDRKRLERSDTIRRRHQANINGSIILAGTDIDMYGDSASTDSASIESSQSFSE